MAIKKLYVIYYVYIDFIKSSSSNCWIEINFEFKNVVVQILKFLTCV
jgi:hypothetical protein